MVFSSYIFICVFLPVTLATYYLLSRFNNDIYQRAFLIAASLFFYGYQNVYYLLLIVVSILINFMLSTLMTKYRKAAKTILIIGVIFNIALLGYFKYFNFIIDNINFIFKTSYLVDKIMLPLGISFFTFQQLSFLISVYKKEQKLGRFIDYSVFVTFFPQLVAGPIVLYNEMIPQFEEKSIRYYNPDNFSKGLYMFAIGLFKKAVIADTLAVFANNGFSMTDLGLIPAWAVVLSYTLQLYFDFSGYCDMAIGIGRMFNIILPINFESPYKSASISEFWRRWHITLGRALGTYVYRPLGGNRKGIVRTCTNLMITFFISGLWHGAAWTFIIWGGLHGLMTVIEKIFKKYVDKVPNVMRVTTTFLLVNILWVLFRAESFANAFNIYKGMINIGNTGLFDLKDIVFDGLINFPTIIDIIYIVGMLIILLIVVFSTKSSNIMLQNYKPTYKTLIFTLVLFCISLLFVSRESVFIYFNF